jgi:hypothetical protein
MKRYSTLILLFSVLFPLYAFAANPGDACTGQSGSTQFDAGTLLVCDGAIWNQASQLSSIEGRLLFQTDYDPGTCAGTKLGRLRYNSAGSPEWQYCNGSAWTSFPQVLANGYFVQTTTKWNGNLGGLSGANAKCLTELQTTYNWNGKANAGTLNSTRVYAWLCDGTSCNNLKANTTYQMAKANSTTACGWIFQTDSSGRAPNASLIWDYNCMDSSADTWTNRSTVTVLQAGTTPKGTNHCTNWSTSSSSKSGGEGNTAYTDSDRWDQSQDPCNFTNFLYCVVDP